MIDYNSLRNLPWAFFDEARKRAAAPFLWSKSTGEWQAINWKETAARVSALSRGLRELGVNAGDRVAIISENRPEWLIADLAIMAAGAVSVPAYTTNTVEDFYHIFADSGARLAMVSTASLAERVVPAAMRVPETEIVITMDAAPADVQGTRMIAWDDVMALGQATRDDTAEQIAAIARTDTCCIIYTSGTGGRPKGVMLSHGAILCNCRGAYELLRPLPEFSIGGEVFLSFLPLSHSYEHTAGMIFPMTIGAQIYYAQSMDRLVADMAETRPTIMTAVPRLYEIIHGRILSGVQQAGGLKQKMFMKALELGQRRLDTGARLTGMAGVMDRILERLVRDKVRQRFGGRLQAFVSGGAPLNPEIGRFFLALGVRILQGYGQTESAPVISCNPVHEIKLRTVGPAVKNTEVKIAEDGEILARGELLMQGYWNNPRATAEVLRDGWLYTGDIGELDADGFLRITDRKKDIIVNSGGDNMSPQRVEGMLTIEPAIAQAMVYGDRRPYLVALIVPDAENGGDIGEAVRRVNAKLSNIERIRHFVIADELFTTENEMMTPSLKIRRHVIRAKYGNQLDALYGG